MNYKIGDKVMLNSEVIKNPNYRKYFNKIFIISNISYSEVFGYPEIPKYPWYNLKDFPGINNFSGNLLIPVEQSNKEE